MRILAVILFLLTSLNLRSQSYIPFPMSNTEWSVERYEWNFPFPDMCITRFYGYNSDTLINGQTYAKLYGNNLPGDYPYFSLTFDSSTASYVAGVREDSTKKVWIRLPNDTADILYYDFSLEVGDTFNFDYFGVDPYVVSSVDTVWIYGALRRQIHFPVNSPEEIWIEGVGSNTGWFEWQHMASWWHTLRCFNNIPTLGSGGCYCDTYVLDVDDLLGFENPINIYPNPTTGQTTISLEEPFTGSLRVLNSLGQIVLSDSFEATRELDISLDVPSGLYFVQLEVDGELITKKVVKE